LTHLAPSKTRSFAACVLSNMRHRMRPRTLGSLA
jgi:hypothetical protein